MPPTILSTAPYYSQLSPRTLCSGNTKQQGRNAISALVDSAHMESTLHCNCSTCILVSQYHWTWRVHPVTHTLIPLIKPLQNVVYTTVNTIAILNHKEVHVTWVQTLDLLFLPDSPNYLLFPNNLPRPTLLLWHIISLYCTARDEAIRCSLWQQLHEKWSKGDFWGLKICLLSWTWHLIIALQQFESTSAPSERRDRPTSSVDLWQKIAS